MRVALIIDVTRKGGADLFLKKLTKELERRDHEPVLLSNKKMEKQESVYLPFSKNQSALDRLRGAYKSRKKVRDQVDVGEFDLFFFMSPISALSLFSSFSGLPSIYSPRFATFDEWNLIEQNKIKAYINKFIESTALKKDYSDIVALSEDMKQKFNKNGVSNEGIEVISIGVDTETFFPKQRPQQVNKVGFAGAFNELKGFPYLMKAIKLILQRNKDIRFLLAGDSKEKYKELGYSEKEKIDVLGRLSHQEMPDFYRECDLLVLPSLTEGLPRTALESLASGTPVIGSKVGGIPEVVIDKETGYLVPPKEPREIKQKIQKLMDNPELLTRMAENSVELIKEKYDDKKNLNKLIKHMEETANA